MSEIDDKKFWHEHAGKIGASTVLGLGALAFTVVAVRRHHHAEEAVPEYDIPPDDDTTTSDNS